jgi:putative ABC transport system permease protein
MYILRILITQPLRLFLTITGIALCIILILFILGIYSGVAEGSIEYVKRTKADLWVLQANNNNIMRGTSILPSLYLKGIKKDSSIQSATPVLLFFSNIKTGTKSTTVLLAGFEPGAMGGPPIIYKGRNVLQNDEIVLDKSFAKKYNIKVEHKVLVQKDTLRVVGLSSGTNAFVTQYAFTTFEFTQSIIELPGLASFFIIKAIPGSSLSMIKERIEKRFPGVFSIYENDEFLKNNIHEMEAGILPLFYAIAAIGGVVLTIILSLILSVNILEKRKDFAIMKIIGSPNLFLNKLILLQALIISVAAEVIGIIFFFPLVELIESLSPEVTTIISIEHIVYITIIICFVTIFSSYFSSRHIRKIYPAEVFS